MFITFRTADSMPKEVSIRWQRELEHCLTANQLPLALAASTAVKKTMRHDDMIEKMSAAQRREFKKLSDRFFQRSLDNCHGKCLLKRAELAEIVGNAMLFYNEEKYDLDRFVVMPNHVHAIVQFRMAQAWALSAKAGCGTPPVKSIWTPAIQVNSGSRNHSTTSFEALNSSSIYSSTFLTIPKRRTYAKVSFCIGNGNCKL